MLLNSTIQGSVIHKTLRDGVGVWSSVGGGCGGHDDSWGRMEKGTKYLISELK